MRILLCFLALIYAGACLPPPAAEAQQLPDGAAFTLAEGSWAWERADSTCRRNRFRIEFSGDRREMVMTGGPTADGAPSITRYRVLGTGPGLNPRSPLAIRLEAVGETRRTPAGDLVVWDMILASPDRMYWHRTDWPLFGSTGAMMRCEGDRPVESFPPRSIPDRRLPRT